MEKYRAKCFCLVLYEEDETHKKAMEKIKASYDYAMICHDRDTNEDGEVLKPHYHIVLRFQNARWSSALAEELGITENYFEEARSLKRSLLYLIHFYEEDKFQYSINDVSGPLKKRLQEFIKNDGKSESEKVLAILDEIDGIRGEIKYKVFIRHVANIGYWDVFRRSPSVFIRYMDEHNKKC